jgi:hypothetical protein
LAWALIGMPNPATNDNPTKAAIMILMNSPA